MSILTDLQPAIYRGIDVTGTEVQGGKVLGLVRVHTYPSGNKHHIWRAECLNCQRVFESQAQKIMTEGKGFCKGCYGEGQRGTKSPHWKGGSYVPGYFVAKVQTKLSRKSRLIDYSLTLDYLDALWKKQGGCCAYTKLELSFGSNVDECTASLDRIDSSGDYIEGNVQFVHKTINKMKWDLTDMEFRNFCVLVAKNL